MTRIVFALLIGLVLCGCNNHSIDTAVSASGDSLHSEQNVGQTRVPAIHAEVRQLIEQLVSPNKPTNPDSEPFVDYPPDYDYEAQKTVADASARLEEIGYDAVSFLIDNIDDKRYSCTRSYSILVDYSVGQECFRIVDSILDPDVSPDYSVLSENEFKNVKGHPMRLGLDGEWDYTELSFLDLLIHRDQVIANHTEESIMAWWIAGSFESIEHAHLAAVDRLIKHEQSIGFETDFNKTKYLSPYFELKRNLEQDVNPNN